MKLDLIKPCKNCPFGNTKDSIVFACRQRAADILEQAYRHGFPCHLSAEHVEVEDDYLGEGGFYPGENSQQCAGALMLFLTEGGGTPWPAIMSRYNDYDREGDEDDIDEEIMSEMWERMDWTASHFESEEDYLEANSHGS
jgi:hypothetical protein